MIYIIARLESELIEEIVEDIKSKLNRMHASPY